MTLLQLGWMGASGTSAQTIRQVVKFSLIKVNLARFPKNFYLEGKVVGRVCGTMINSV